MKTILVMFVLALIPCVWSQEKPEPTIVYEIPCKEKKIYKEGWQRFIADNYPVASYLQTKYGIDPLFVLAQSAVESGYGAHAPGNMYFAIKDFDGINGNEQLLLTTEYFSSKDVKLPYIISIDSLAPDYYCYHLKEWFRKFKTPYESFEHHSIYLNKRLKGKTDYNAWELADKMTGLNYATVKGYPAQLRVAIKRIKTFIDEEHLTEEI